MKEFYLKLTFFVFSLFFLAFPASAQMPILDEFLTLRLSPANPAPLETVVAKIELNLTDLKRAEMSWYINGELQEDGVGITDFEFEVGPAGSATRLNLELITAGGQRFNREITIRPAEVDIVWNAETYSPPFYQGRSAFTNRSDLSVSAVPIFLNEQSNAVDPKLLVYRWYVNNSFFSDGSGLGRDKINLSSDVITRPIDVRVVVENFNGTIRAEKRIVINKSEPKVLIYENSPLYGLLLNRALSDLELTEREITLSSIPYFFSTLSRENRDLEYVWRQGGQIIRTPGNQSLITLRNENGGAGLAEVSVSVRHKNRLLQNAGANISINLSQ